MIIWWLLLVSTYYELGTCLKALFVSLLVPYRVMISSNPLPFHHPIHVSQASIDTNRKFSMGSILYYDSLRTSSTYLELISCRQ
ncbi:hypothetical protein BKA56DRAFT_568997 [Ilyonectria sp. MPI-CAGE-AT-0026]|nr:hypothetical protein BKA56DRAFT_568997 [Ilyonectria sp. MPI-CAGE-AT-0026]